MGVAMKLRLASLSLLALCLTLVSVPAMAQYNDIYDNGPTNGNTSSWALDGYPTVPVVSDTFTLTSSNWIDGFDFAAWVPPGYALASANLSITSQENGGTVYLDQTFQFFMQDCVLNNYGYDVCIFSTGFAGPVLNSGTYWVNLTNGQESGGTPLYWDENSGPSSASQNEVGTIPSESFTVFGEYGTSTTTGTTSSTGSSVPEPGSIVLFGSGFLGLLALLRRKLF
jgi:hypothetical protein